MKTTFLTTKDAITKWLDKHEVKNYSFIPDEKYGFVVNIEGDIVLFRKILTHIPVNFNKVSGYFFCGHNQLISLEFCPSHVGGNFYCADNSQLKEIQEISDFHEIYRIHRE